MHTTTKSSVYKASLRVLTVVIFVWMLWFKSLLNWLRAQQKSVLFLGCVLIAEWLGWNLWGLHWMVLQILILGLLAYTRRPMWLNKLEADNLLPVLIRLFKAAHTVEDAMFVTVNLSQVSLENTDDYSAPLLTVPYEFLFKNQRPLVSAIALTNGILFAEKGELVFDLSFLTDANKQAFIARMADAGINQDWPVVASIIKEHEQQKVDEQRTALEHKISSVVKSDKSKGVLRILLSKGTQWGIGIWNLNDEGIKESENALLVRVRLLGDTTISGLHKQLPSIAKTTRIKVVINELTDKGSANLIFKLHSQYSGRQMTVEQVANNAKNGRFDLGIGDLGPIALRLPQSDFPATLIGGLSRSGKSTLATMLIVALLNLKTISGKRTYEDVFVGSVKDEDYRALGWDKRGMYIAGNPSDVYMMLKQVDSLCTDRKRQFVKSGVINISQYNQQHSDAPMPNMLVVIDEYANLISRAESESLEIDGKEVKLSKEIERLCVKIAQEHISRGCTLIVITQNFAKNALGKVYDAVGAKFVGYAEANVASSLDNTGELANAMRGQELTRKGLFFVNSPDLQPTPDTVITKMKNGYFQVRTNYLDTRDVANNFDENYETDNLYRRNTIVSVGKVPFI